MTQTDIVEALNNELKALFPTSGVNARIRRLLGHEDVCVLYTNAQDVSQCSNRIWENDRAYMHFSIERNRDGSAYIEAPTMHFTNNLREAGVKFRKINAPDEATAATKLVAWFKKNRDAILSVGLSIDNRN